MSSTPGKSREEILAERKARKKNKGGKNHPKTKDLDPALIKATANVSIDTEALSLGDGNSPEKVESLEEKNEKILSQHSNALNESSKDVPTKKQPSEKNEPQKSNKSREEILAEREAKRLAKQSAKKKDKVSALEKSDVQQEINEDVRKVENQASDINSKTLDIVPDSKTTETVDKSIKNESTETEKVEEKSKAQLRAERRAKQEAQRAKKLEQKLTTADENKIVETVKPTQIVKKSKPAPQTVVSHRVKLFAHLYHDLPDLGNRNLHVKVHPIILRLGTQYSSGIISGANVRCLALLNAFKTVITDFETPQNQEFSRGLEAEITKSMSYLNKCRPVAVSMVNAVKHLKYQVSRVKGTEIQSKSQLKEWIDTYIKEQLETAAEAICISVRKKITNNDVILTYGCSSLIQRILISASRENVKFRVIVVDGRPWLEGREMLRKLVSVGIHCTYIFVNGLSFIMPEVTKVLLGAHALLANGYVMSRAGSSQIALLAKAYNVPVLVCCETHKFSERVQTDSFVYNELGDPNDLVSNRGCLSTGLAAWKSIPYLTPLNLKYDVTPPDLVSAVVTEIAVLPCTSVPVILRIKPPEVSC